MRGVSKANCTNFKVKAIPSDLAVKSYLNTISVLNLDLCVFKSIYKSVLEHVFFFLSWKVDAAQVV